MAETDARHLLGSTAVIDRVQFRIYALGPVPQQLDGAHHFKLREGAPTGIDRQLFSEIGKLGLQFVSKAGQDGGPARGTPGQPGTLGGTQLVRPGGDGAAVRRWNLGIVLTGPGISYRYHAPGARSHVRQPRRLPAATLWAAPPRRRSHTNFPRAADQPPRGVPATGPRGRYPLNNPWIQGGTPGPR